MNYQIVFLVFVISLYGSITADKRDPRNNIYLLKKYPQRRVDEDVKKPTRFCQGFEDPSDTECYMRTGVKTYVCTEPVAFNPCESDTHILVWHYDHIKHKCVQESTPVCAGNIIRTLTLIQCLIYCHNKDPYALGKSNSVIYKLNQKKPFIADSTDNREDAHKKAAPKKGKKSVKADKKPIVTKKHDQEDVNDNVYLKSLNGDAELAEYLLQNLKKGVDKKDAKYLIENIKEDSRKAINESPSIDKIESSVDKKKLKEDSKVGGMLNDIVGDSILDKKSIDSDSPNPDKLSDTHLKSDSTDYSENDGFYLWDE